MKVVRRKRLCIKRSICCRRACGAIACTCMLLRCCYAGYLSAYGTTNLVSAWIKIPKILLRGLRKTGTSHPVDTEASKEREAKACEVGKRALQEALGQHNATTSRAPGALNSTHALSNMHPVKVRGMRSAFRSLTSIFAGQRSRDQGWMEGFLTSASNIDFMRAIKHVRTEVERLLDSQDDENRFSLLESGFRPDYGIIANEASAWRNAGGWAVPVEAWIFRRNIGRHRIRLALCQKLLLEMKYGIKDVSPAAQERYEDRARLIFRNLAFRGGERNRKLQARFVPQDSNEEWLDLPRETDRHGRLNHIFQLSAEKANRISNGTGTITLEIQCSQPPTNPPPARVVIHLVEEEGLSVISDIDDTVKVTEVFLGKGKVTRNTFFEEFRAVPGMVDMFQAWTKQVPGMSFHFVSNSPPELIEPLRDFLSNAGFPPAPLHLRPLWGKHRATFKMETIETLFKNFPRRRFVLVGDSGEKDPLIYSDLCRRYPNQVVRVLIREVDASRRVEEQIFAGIDKEKWQVFSDPTEVPIQSLLSA